MRILFFPLSNVLGHLTRTLALAEEFEAHGHEAFVAMDRTYARLTKALPRTIRVLPAREMFAAASRSFGPIREYGEEEANDRVNLESADRLTDSELRRRGRRLAQMVERDAAIVNDVRPDAIVTDYHFTAPLLPIPPRTPVFHVSHILGYPSFHRRVMGADFFPLDSGHILVPGLEDIEYAGRAGRRRRESICGVFRWRGWQRLHKDDAQPPRSNVFLFFGSTGNANEIVPWLLRAIPKRYRVSSIAPGQTGDPERFLKNTDVVFCHGGHGTVMECILHQTPMAIFPHNIEQLEIGRRIEAMRLGLLIRRPYDQLSGNELAEVIETIRTDAAMKASLRKYSELLRRENGPKRAVSTVLRGLADARG